MAILREQGVNGHVEMAASFDRAGFAAYDVHMSDIIAGVCHLKDFAGFVACGGFSMAMYWALVRAGRNPFCLIAAHAMSFQPFLTAQ